MTHILNGKYVEVKDAEAKAILGRENNVALLSRLNLSAEDFEVKKSYKYDQLNVLSGRVIGVVTTELSNKDVQFHVVETLDHEGKVATATFADVLEKEGQTSVYLAMGGKVERISQEVLSEGFPVIIANGLPHDENFELKSTKEDELVEQALPFCIPGYKHCGPGCGDNKTFGGGTPINSIDNCCRSHDRCWDSFGDWDACCDKRLVNCVTPYRGSNQGVVNAIVSTFGYNALKCK